MNLDAKLLEFPQDSGEAREETKDGSNAFNPATPEKPH